VEWDLLRSTIMQPCNYSGWFDADLAAEFGVVSFDWANHENSCVTQHTVTHPHRTGSFV